MGMDRMLRSITDGYSSAHRMKGLSDLSKKTKKEQPQTEQPQMEPLRRDDALFEALGKSKKKKKRKILRTILIVVLVVAIVLVAGVAILQKKVREQFASSDTEVLSYEVTTGTISTVVSGSGTLSNVDTETVTIPSGVEISDILVSYGQTVTQGQLLATVDMTTVRTAMSTLQQEIEDLDEQISEAEGDQVASYIQAGVSGRVKVLYAGKSDDVASVMVESGALAIISLDGYMALDVETDALAAGDTVTVVLSDGTEVTGTVESAAGGSTTILISDDGPAFGEEVTVLSGDTQIGTGTLYIHNPLAVTGYAGTISAVRVSENQKVTASTNLFTLTDTSYSANYDSLLRSRSEKEETLLELLAIQKNGGITAPIAGSVYSVNGESGATELLTLSPDVSMSVTISVDEADILSLEVGQEADVTVSSVSEDSFTGTVTEIDTSSASGSYTAVITLDKVTGMLPGMTASVDVKIEGVEDAILIPVEAMHQTSTGAYVYTSYDEETQEYGGKVDIVIGLQGSSYVEVKSGLSVGDTVYYTESQSFTDMFGGMGFGNMGGDMSGNMGGSMPDMGNMPDMNGGDRGDFGSGGQMPGGMGGN